MTSFIAASILLTFSMTAASVKAFAAPTFETAMVTATTEPALAEAKKKTVRKKVASKLKSKGGNTRFERGSEETVAERSARLKRECKGRVNAGACAGYTD